MNRLYVDTSALAKWYLPEHGSDAVTEIIQQHAPVLITRLTQLEMRSLLARRRRERAIRPAVEAKVLSAFRADVEQGHLVCHPVTDEPVRDAFEILDRLTSVPLRTLDALHLALARHLAAEVVVTADRVMAVAAKALDLRVMTVG